MDEFVVKICSKCGAEKDLSCFSKDARKKSGLRALCKECHKEYMKEYNKNNKEKAKEYYRNNNEIIAKYHKEHYQKNKEDIDKKQKEHYQKNKKTIAKRQKEYYNNNKEARAEYHKKWVKNNRDRVNECEQRRRALKKSLTVEHVDYEEIRKRDHICYLCLVPFTDEERFDASLTHIDHKIPLCRTELNPTHSYENCALTHSLCNLQKQARTPEEYWVSLSKS